MEMFIIVPPLNPWDHPKDEIMIRMGAGTIAPSAGGAWKLHTRGKPEQVQAWFDKGYRVRCVDVQLKAEEP